MKISTKIQIGWIQPWQSCACGRIKCSIIFQHKCARCVSRHFGAWKSAGRGCFAERFFCLCGRSHAVVCCATPSGLGGGVFCFFYNNGIPSGLKADKLPYPCDEPRYQCDTIKKRDTYAPNIQEPRAIAALLSLSLLHCLFQGADSRFLWDARKYPIFR